LFCFEIHLSSREIQWQPEGGKRESQLESE